MVVWRMQRFELEKRLGASQKPLWQVTTTQVKQPTLPLVLYMVPFVVQNKLGKHESIVK
jgi:RNAse (barnase) inhibitor barstar